METLPEINKSICILPWDAVAIRPYSTAMPCCRFRTDHNFVNDSNVHMDFRNSPKWDNIRQRMLDGVKLPECQQCYNEEESGKTSTRQLDNMEYIKLHKKLPITVEPIKLRFLEVAFSNLCNLACVSCNAWFSSTWGTEDHKRGRLSSAIPKVLVEHRSEIDSLDLSELQTLKMIGGEPFMDQKRFINILERIDLSKIKLLISTNGTVLPNEQLKFLMDQCNKVVLEVSIDGVDSVNEWYRWPTKVSEVEAVMNQYQEWWGNNPKFFLKTHTVVNIYNIWNLDEFVDYMNNKYPTWVLDFDWMNQPFWQATAILPKKYKEELTEKLNKWSLTVKGNWHEWQGNPFVSTLHRMNLPAKSTLDEFKKHTLALAKERDLDVFKMVPHIARLFEDSVDNTPE
jgi:sulfatase maturation enzyme AslB (radical SAM superfamily)